MAKRAAGGAIDVGNVCKRLLLVIDQSHIATHENANSSRIEMTFVWLTLLQIADFGA